MIKTIADSRRRFETLLGEAVKGHSLTLYAYVMMPNHFHLLLEVSRAPLSRAMQSLLYRNSGGFCVPARFVQ
jgi:REP element-mobilizing transposase RayT